MNTRQSNRDRALATIRAEVSEHGRVTYLAMRAYVENRISRAAFDEAVAYGIRVWKLRSGSCINCGADWRYYACCPDCGSTKK